VWILRLCGKQHGMMVVALLFGHPLIFSFRLFYWAIDPAVTNACFIAIPPDLTYRYLATLRSSDSITDSVFTPGHYSHVSRPTCKPMTFAEHVIRTFKSECTGSRWQCRRHTYRPRSMAARRR
jgi:hypothetical protein